MFANNEITIFWFRRDLRLHDNAGLHFALSHYENVIPIFIFDRNILDKLDDKEDRRISFIYERIALLKKQCIEAESDLLVFNQTPIEVFKTLDRTYTIKAVVSNFDYEPYGIKRDAEIESFCKTKGFIFAQTNDHLLFHPSEVLKPDKSPYTIFTPYKNCWMKLFSLDKCNSFASENMLQNLSKMVAKSSLPTLYELGFRPTAHLVSESNIDLECIKEYHTTRNFPAIRGTSRLSVHLRFGTISIRSLLKIAFQNNQIYLNELIWREFYATILFHYSNVETSAFKPKYNNIAWSNNLDFFDRWCKGETGYPIVDAAMNEINSTGFMHNRARMIVSSFLTKHLLVDWRLGEAYFAQKLTDCELASNNGGWQWAAGSGCDAAPYFRIFNPYLQTKKFDPNNQYILQWNGFKNIEPIVNHEVARNACLKVYKNSLNTFL